jgi:hypothetical protein
MYYQAWLAVLMQDLDNFLPLNLNPPNLCLSHTGITSMSHRIQPVFV